MSLRAPSPAINAAREWADPSITSRDLGRTLAIAAATTGVAEILLHRGVVPVAVHLPGDGGATLATSILLRGAAMSMAATALLVMATAIAWSVALRRRHPIMATTILSVAALTVAASISVGTTPRLLVQAATIAAVVAILVVATRISSPLHGVALAMAGIAIAASQWPLLLDALNLSSGDVAARTIAEVALIATPIVFAVSVVRRGRASLAALLAGIGAGLAIALVSVLEPTHVAGSLLWAFGVTLSLAPFAYVVAGTCLTFVAVTWLRDRTGRVLLAGLVLLAVAGIGPTALHHNVAAVTGLVLLASSAPGFQSEEGT
jgi:hypothetical protein